MFCTIMWKIWFARNQNVFKQLNVIPHIIAAEAMEFVSEYNKALPKKQSHMQHNQVTAPIDQFPNPYIVQVDAGCFGVTTAGCVIKDPCGTIILSAYEIDTQARAHHQLIKSIKYL
jgi:hypothetical protein